MIDYFGDDESVVIGFGGVELWQQLLIGSIGLIGVCHGGLVVLCMVGGVGLFGCWCCISFATYASS